VAIKEYQHLALKILQPQYFLVVSQHGDTTCRDHVDPTGPRVHVSEGQTRSETNRSITSKNTNLNTAEVKPYYAES